MREFEQKRKIQKRIYSPITIVVLIIILFFVGRGTYTMYIRAQESEKQLDLVSQKLADLDETKERLEEQVADLHSVVGKEEEARARFGLAKEDEQVIVIIDEEDPPVVVEEESLFESLWDQFLSLITF